jgi:hypothetical protein
MTGMNGIEDRLRDAMAVRAGAVQDSHRPLPAPRARRGRVVLAVAVAVAVLGAVRLPAALPGAQGEEVAAMSLTGATSPAEPVVKVFFCADDDPRTSCEGGKITEAERVGLLRALEARPEVAGVAFEDRQEAWERFRRAYQEKSPNLVRATNPEDMPESYRVEIRPGASASDVTRAASEMPGVSVSVDGECAELTASVWGVVKRFVGVAEKCSVTGKGR